MRLTDEERAAIRAVVDYGGIEPEHEAALRSLLAREAEHATLVTPEWLDGAEGKRLGFELQADVSHAFGNRIRRWSSGVVELIESDGIMRLHGITYYDPLYSPTIRQVRLAVELATGRR